MSAAGAPEGSRQRVHPEDAALKSAFGRSSGLRLRVKIGARLAGAQ
jgi:hypothetical protein